MMFTGMEANDLLLTGTKVYSIEGPDKSGITYIPPKYMFRLIRSRGPLCIHLNTPTAVLNCCNPGFDLLIGDCVYSWTEEGLVERPDKSKLEELKKDIEMPCLGLVPTALFDYEDNFAIGGVYYKLFYARWREKRKYELKTAYKKISVRQREKIVSMEIYLEREFMKLEERMKNDF